MAEVSSYLTSAEATLRFNDADYGVTVKAAALADSFGLTNSYLAPTIKVPVGSSPVVLKQIQLRFYRWCLQTYLQGQTEELQDLFDATVEICRSVQQHELLIDTQTAEIGVGWSITGISTTSGKAWMSSSPPPVRPVSYVLTCAEDAWAVDTVSFTVTRDDDDATLETVSLSTTEAVIDGSFGISITGEWAISDTITISGKPDVSNKVSPSSSTFKTVSLAY